MKDNVIQLGKQNTLKFAIITEDGTDTGNYLEFDLEDIELPLRLNECEAQHRKNVEWVKMQYVIIDKKEDLKGKYILTKNQEEKIRVTKEFYLKEIDALDLFLGKNGTRKLLNGRNPYYEMYDDINKYLKPIMPKLKINADNIANKIKNKYSTQKKEDNVLE